MARERTGHPISYAKDKKIKLLTLQANGYLKASLAKGLLFFSSSLLEIL